MNLGWISSFLVMSEMTPLTLQVYFFGASSFFSQGGNATSLTPTHIYRKYHISTRFLIKIIFFHFPPKEKIYFLEKKTIFPDITKKIMFRCEFFGKAIFLEHLKKISYFQIFFWERSSFVLCLKNKIIFSGKKNIIFPDNARKIIFQYDFFGKTIFQTIWKKKIWFFVQCRAC